MSRPPTLRWLMADGVSAANAWCHCGHEGRVPFDRWPGETEFPDLERRIRCSRCGRRPYQVMPAWELRCVLGTGKPPPR